MKGFDVSALTGKELKVWVDYNEVVKVLVRPVTRERYLAILAEATIAKFDNKTHLKSSELDSLKLGGLLGEAVIVDWSGLVDSGEPFLCTQENRALLMRSWVDFAKFISDIATDLERMVTAEKESERKNSPSTSVPDPTTQG